MQLILTYILFCLICSSPFLGAQELQYEVMPFEVQEASGEPMLNPFSGGLDLTRIGLHDVEGDGDPDLFTYNIGEHLRLYRNEGEEVFQRVADSPWDSIPIRSWFRLADLDSNGTVDLFTSGERSELLVFWNNGTDANPVFSPSDTLRQTDESIIYSEQLTVPTFADIDSDEDLDLFSGNVDGTITFYENIGSKSVPDFIFRTRKFEGLLVISPAGTERKKDEVSTSSSMHGASVLDFVDLDGDEDLDILFGDFFTKKMLHFENRGTRFVPSFDTLWVDSAFAPTGDIVESSGFNQAVSGDVNRDGTFDVFVSSLLASAVDSPVRLYLNRGTATQPLMRQAGGNITSEIDAGRYAAPAWLKDDEREGLLIGSEDGSITWFEATIENGRTTLRLSRRYVLNGLTLSAPATGDLDGDGKAEIVVGKGDALDGTTLRLYHFEDDALVRIPWQLDTTFNVARSSASPALVDLDDDQDLDLFVGARNGRFYLFENVGSPTVPLFEVTMPPAPFDTLDLGSDIRVSFADIDNDGDMDVIAGSRQTDGVGSDTLRFWLNENGRYREDNAWPPLGILRNPAPLYMELPEGEFLFVGTRSGGLLAYQNTSVSLVEREREKSAEGAISVVITEGGDEMMIRWQGLDQKEFILVDLGGRERVRFFLDTEKGDAVIPVHMLPAGFYLWSVDGARDGSLLLVR